MVKIFSVTDHHELEILINNWLNNNQIIVIDIKYSICPVDDTPIYSAIIVYEST